MRSISLIDFPSFAGQSIQNILPDCFFKERWFLLNEADLRPEMLDIPLFDIESVDFDVAFSVVKSLNELNTS